MRESGSGIMVENQGSGSRIMISGPSVSLFWEFSVSPKKFEIKGTKNKPHKDYIDYTPPHVGIRVLFVWNTYFTPSPTE